MACPLTIDQGGFWYHITSRGNGRPRILKTEAGGLGLEGDPGFFTTDGTRIGADGTGMGTGPLSSGSAPSKLGGSRSFSLERRYYLSSLAVDVEGCARAVRGHWIIENSLHWVLDVQCGEGRSRVRSGHAASNLATLRRMALNHLKQEKTKKRGIRGKQLNASWDHAYLLRLLMF